MSAICIKARRRGKDLTDGIGDGGEIGMMRPKNFYDFYCEECNSCVDMFNRRGDGSTKWCEMHSRRVQEHDQACSDFVLYEEGEDWNEQDI